MSETKEKKGNIFTELLSLIITVILILGLAYVLVHYVGQRVIVNGSSMEPTLQNGDNMITDKLFYKKDGLKRFDIVVFPYPANPSTHYIKRVIGLPGEKVRIDENGVIYINDEALDEHYGLETIENPGNAINEITLSGDEYFVLGDNRNDSEDSRFDDVGLIKKKDITGKAWVRLYPNFCVIKK